MPGVIIPRKTVSEIRRLIDGMDSDVHISVSEAKIRFRTGNAIMTSKLIDGTFPDYERVIPKGNNLPVDYAADPLEIGFNAKYLLDVAGQIEGRDATFFLDSPASPALVKDSEDEHALFVLMPLRV